MVFIPEFVQKLFFTRRSFDWNSFCTHQHFSGLHWITETLLRTRHISFDRVLEVLQTVEFTLMSQLCQKVFFFFFNFWSWQNKTEQHYFIGEYRGSAVRNLETYIHYIQKHQMCINLEKTRLLLKAVSDNENRGQVRIFFSSSLEIAYREGGIGKKYL